ncbi:hypothetical protein GCM10010302_26650 [Streptomyces polychromogenes]|uniref:Uncharacterized protein n=1 Tax=Streptomyces polychromogenes TaxID=67342 RepID=A0ABP3EZR4_9ACTN
MFDTNDFVRAVLDELNDREFPVIKVPMKMLRNLVEGKRLRDKAVNDIAAALAQRGLRYLPAQIPRDENRSLLVWTPGVPGTEMLDLVLRMDQGSDIHQNGERLTYTLTEQDITKVHETTQAAVHHARSSRAA